MRRVLHLSATNTWQFDSGFMDRYDATPPELAKEETVLEDDVLPSSRIHSLCSLGVTHVIAREKDHGETDLVDVVLELFDDGPPHICLLMENDRALAQNQFEEPRNLVLGLTIVTVDHEYSRPTWPGDIRGSVLDLGLEQVDLLDE